MVGALIISHGTLAAELVRVASVIVGGLERVQALGIDWQQDRAEAQRAIAEALAELQQGEGVLILTDLFGGTPTNLSLPFLESGRVEIVTGVNLPMVIKLASLQRAGLSLAELAHRVQERGRASQYVASELLAGRARA